MATIVVNRGPSRSDQLFDFAKLLLETRERKRAEKSEADRQRLESLFQMAESDPAVLESPAAQRLIEQMAPELPGLDLFAESLLGRHRKELGDKTALEDAYSRLLGEADSVYNRQVADAATALAETLSPFGAPVGPWPQLPDWVAALQAGARALPPSEVLAAQTFARGGDGRPAIPLPDLEPPRPEQTKPIQPSDLPDEFNALRLLFEDDPEVLKEGARIISGIDPSGNVRMTSGVQSETNQLRAGELALDRDRHAAKVAGVGGYGKSTRGKSGEEPSSNLSKAELVKLTKEAAAGVERSLNPVGAPPATRFRVPITALNTASELLEEGSDPAPFLRAAARAEMARRLNPSAAPGENRSAEQLLKVFLKQDTPSWMWPTIEANWKDLRDRQGVVDPFEIHRLIVEAMYADGVFQRGGR